MTTITHVLVQVEPGDGATQAEPSQWAIGELIRCLRERRLGASMDPSSGHQLRIRITASSDDRALKASLPAGAQLPLRPESFAIARRDGEIVVWGYDGRGIAHGVTELADRVRHEVEFPFDFETPILEEPATRIRSICRTFACEATDKSWFYDKSFWTEYLNMLAFNRFNRFSLALGFAYNYPYHNNMIKDVYLHFPYPFLVDLPGYGIRAIGLPDHERDTNLEMLRFISRETARRGLEFQLGLWTQRYDFADAARANYPITGVTETNHPAYCRDAITQILKACPDITGVTLRIHVEGGVEEGDYGFWENLFEGVASVGRPIEIDMHPKGLDHSMLAVARQSGLPFAVSPKYIAEHMALPYHTSAIREREYPPAATGDIREQLSRGARKFLRYSYGDLLSKDRDWKVIFRIWPGSQRVLLWGDPAMAAGYGRSSAYCGADGVEFCEPQTFRGRMGTGLPGGRHNYKVEELAPRYDWQKYEYQYRVWGRLLFSPTANPDGWSRFLRSECGDAAENCERGLSYASRILPLVTQTHGPSVSNNLYWPEVYTNLPVVGDGPKRPYGADMDQPTRFGNVSTFDPQLFANPKELVESLAAGTLLRKYTPLDVADWLEELAQNTDEHALALKKTMHFHTAPVQRVHLDLQILACLGRFFAEKYRASCWAELFLLTGQDVARIQALDHLKRGCLAWRTAAQVSRDIYQDDLAFGPQHYMRGSWASRLGDIEHEFHDLESWREGDGPPPDRPGREGLALVEALRERPRTVSRASGLKFSPTFVAGERVRVTCQTDSAEADLMLHYRHVNQAERWQAVPMSCFAGGHFAEIPAEYTDSNFHLQFYVTAVEGGSVTLTPGLAPDLSNEPYHTVLLR